MSTATMDPETENPEATEAEHYDFHARLKRWQNEFIFSPYQLPGMVCAWATGKTMALIGKAMLWSEEIPNNLGIIFRKEYEDLRDSTIVDFKQYTGLQVNSKRNAFLPNGSIIMFRHIEELNNIQNINLGWFLIEQADELLTDDAFYTLFGRLRRNVIRSDFMKKLRLPSRFGGIIANAGRDWITDLWIDDPDIGEGFHGIQAKTFDNADVLPEDFFNRIEIMRKKKPMLYRRFVENDHDANVEPLLLIPKKWIKDLRKYEQERDVVRKLVSIDPSAGGDEAVIYYFENEQKVDEMIFDNERDEMKLVGHGVVMAQRHKTRNIVIDATGIGSPMAKRFIELKYRVFPFVYAQSSSDATRWLNLKAEMYDYTSCKIRDGEVYPIDEDEDILIKQLTSIKYEVLNSKGKIKIESKRDYKKRMSRKNDGSGPSPDRADCYAMGIFGLQLVPAMSADPVDPFWSRVSQDLRRIQEKKNNDYAVAVETDEEEAWDEVV